MPLTNPCAGCSVKRQLGWVRKAQHFRPHLTIDSSVLFLHRIATTCNAKRQHGNPLGGHITGLELWEHKEGQRILLGAFPFRNARPSRGQLWCADFHICCPQFLLLTQGRVYCLFRPWSRGGTIGVICALLIVGALLVLAMKKPRAIGRAVEMILGWIRALLDREAVGGPGGVFTRERLF